MEISRVTPTSQALIAGTHSSESAMLAQPLDHPSELRTGPIERRDAVRFLLESSSEERTRLATEATGLLSSVLKLREEIGASDLQFRTDMPIYVHAKDSIPALKDFPRMDVAMMAGLWLALKRADPSYREHDETEYIRGFPSRFYDDFAAEGNNPLNPIIIGCRMRVQVFLFDKGIGITCRILSDDIPELDTLGISAKHIAVLQKIITMPEGIGFVSGPMGSGKTTSLASLVNWAIHNLSTHVVTHEDPIEYRYPSEDAKGNPLPSFVTQQEIGAHLPNFKAGLRSGLRKMSQITLVGEIRDAETMEAAFTASGTGQFVLATTHAESAGGTLDRILDLFDTNRHDSVLSRLANTSRFFLCQKLLYGLQQQRRVLAYEFLQIDPKNTGIKNSMKKWRSARSEFNEHLLSAPNQRFNQHLKELAATGKISQDTATDATLGD